jgi:drug/metabolite transporter (DMT)-like permease
MKQILHFVDPFSFNALRGILAVIGLFTAMIVMKKSLRPPSIKAAVSLGMFQTMGFFSCTAWALVSGGAGKVAVLTYVMPFWVLILAWPMLGERLHGYQWIVVFLSFLGLIFILEPWKLSGTWNSQLIAVAAGIVWAISAIIAKKLQAKEKLDLLSLTAWQILFGTIGLCVIAILFSSLTVQWTGYFVGALLFSSLVCTAGGWLIWSYLLHRLPAGMAGLTMLATPAVGVLAAAIELHEIPSGPEIAGMILIALALILLSRKTNIRSASVS